jgi:alpha-L-rhamnosidase
VTVTIVGVTFEHHREPFGIGEERPCISWQVAADGAAAGVDGSPTSAGAWRQAGYEIEVSAEGEASWSSGRVESAESVLVPWEAPALRSRERRNVRVRVWGAGEGTPSAWSGPAVVEAGLLEKSGWSAVVIGPDRDDGDRPDRPPVLFRRAFELPGGIDRARLYVTAHGVYEAEINGRRIGDQVLGRAGRATGIACDIRPSTSRRSCARVATSWVDRGRRLVLRTPRVPRRTAADLGRRRCLLGPARGSVRRRPR